MKISFGRSIFIIIFFASIYAYSQPYEKVNSNENIIITIEKNDSGVVTKNEVIDENVSKEIKEETPVKLHDHNGEECPMWAFIIFVLCILFLVYVVVICFIDALC